MKKFYITAFIIGIFMAIASMQAGAEEYIGELYTTTATGYIDCYEIPLYVFNGYPYVIAEDLGGYGFDVAWNAKTQTLNIERNVKKIMYPYEYCYWTVDYNKVSDVYLSNTKVKLNGALVSAYSLNGRMLISLDELYRCGKVNWYPESKAISVTTSEFIHTNPDWETLVPAYILMQNVQKAHEESERLYNEMWDAADIYYQIITIPFSIAQQYYGINDYLYECLYAIEDNKYFYYRGDFYHYIYSAIDCVNWNIAEYNLLNGHSFAYYEANFENLGEWNGIYDRYCVLYDIIVKYITFPQSVVYYDV